MKLQKLYDIREMNTFQVIAVTGLIMTAVAHLILNALNKQIPSFEALYPCWVILFVFGYIRNITSKPNHHDHHHHH